MTSEFFEDVRKIVGPTLDSLGFTLHGIDDSPDEGGRYQHVAYYYSVDCKIQIYESGREGSTNCMIAPLDAADSFGVRTRKWEFLAKFSTTPDLPLAALVEYVNSRYNSYANPLEWVRDCITENYQAAHRAIVELEPFA